MPMPHFRRVSEVESVRDLLVQTSATAVASALPQLVEHKSGWLEKEGGAGGFSIKGFQRRWFVLLGSVSEPDAPPSVTACRYLVYYESHEATEAKGCIVLLDNEYSATYPKSERRKHPHCIRIDIRPTQHSDVRVEQKPKWILAADSEEERVSWMGVLGEAGAALTNNIQARKLYCKRAAPRVEAAAERGGWLWKAGKLNPAFKKRWCLLLPPPSDTTGAANPARGEDGLLDRYLAYFEKRDASKPRGVFALPHRGYVIKALDTAALGVAGSSLPMRTQALRIDILRGPETGQHLVLAAGSDSDYFAWELSLHAGQFRKTFTRTVHVANLPSGGGQIPQFPGGGRHQVGNTGGDTGLHVHMPYAEQCEALERISEQAAAVFDREDPADLR